MRFDIAEDTWQAIYRVRGVSRLLGQYGSPSPIPRNAMTDLLKTFGETGAIEEPRKYAKHPAPRVGDYLTVIDRAIHIIQRFVQVIR